MQLEIRTVSGLTVQGNYASDALDLFAAMAGDVTLILLDATTPGTEQPTAQWMFRTRHIESFREL